MLTSTAELIVAIVAVIALFISVISLIWAIIQGKAHLKQLRYASVPAIITGVHFTTSVQENCAGIVVQNAGSGAAIIDSIVIKYHPDDKTEVIQNADEPEWSVKFTQALRAKGIPQPAAGSFTTGFAGSGMVLAAGASLWVVSQRIERQQVVVNTGTRSIDIVGFDWFLSCLEIEVEYRSLFGIRYTTGFPYDADGNVSHL